jgi:hypothetical protein
MADILEEIEDAGRSTDNVVGHLTVGEIVIPMQLAEIPEVKTAIEEIFAAYEVDLDEFTVGNEANKINPETGYPEFFVGRALRAIGNFFTGGDKKKDKDNKNNNSQNSSQSTYNQNAKAFDDAMAAQKKKDEEARLRREKETKDRAIGAESARIRGLALDNQAQIGEQLSQTLATPTQQNATAIQAGYTPSGYNAGKPTKTVPGNAGGPMPTETASAMPAALIAQKINQDSGGTNQQQNRFNIPKTEGLVFGGT